MSRAASSTGIKSLVCVIAALGIVGLSTSGIAQGPPPPPPPPPPSGSVPLPPPPPPATSAPTYYSPDALPPGPLPPTPGYHLHDGFYLRGSLGFGGLAIVTKNSAVSGDVQTTGAAGCLDLAMGGTPARGLVIGGAILTHTMDKPKVKTDQGEVKADGVASMTLIGPMVDVYLNPEGGFHFGGMLGPAVAQVPETSFAPRRTGSGFGAALWAGYGVWISDEWSLGGLARLSGAGAKDSEDVNGKTTTNTHSAGSFSLLVTALYH